MYQCGDLQQLWDTYILDVADHAATKTKEHIMSKIYKTMTKTTWRNKGNNAETTLQDIHRTKQKHRKKRNKTWKKYGVERNKIWIINVFIPPDGAGKMRIFYKLQELLNVGYDIMCGDFDTITDKADRITFKQILITKDGNLLKKKKKNDMTKLNLKILIKEFYENRQNG